MPVQNPAIADLLDEMADVLELQAENPFRVRAYRTAASVVRGRSRPIAAMVEAGEDLTELPGVAEDLAGKLTEIVRTGKLAALDEARGELPVGLVELLKLPGIGPKKARKLYDHLRVGSLAELARVEPGAIAAIRGFGDKTEAAIRAALAPAATEPARPLRSAVEPVARALLDHLRQLPGVKQVEAAGSFRRGKETVGDLDLLATCRRGVDVGGWFARHGDVERVLAKGPTRTTVRLRSGLQVDLRVVPDVSFGAALCYFTGSKAHNIAVRGEGVRRKLKINEYGVFRGQRRVAGRTEADVYAAVGLPWIPPELREDRGELEAAREGRLPELVDIDDLKGDLHVHSTATDGRDSVVALAEAARARGYGYLAVTDPTSGARGGGRLTGSALKAHLRGIDRARDEVGGIELLAGAEVEIRPDGTLDVSDAVLETLDWVLVGVHGALDLPRREQTTRVVRALRNPFVHALAHPLGRILGERPALDLDLEEVVRVAAGEGVLLEIDGAPNRLDLDDVWARAAREAGAKLVITSSARAVDELDRIRHGVLQARRGWLGVADVANARPWKAFRRLLRRAPAAV